MLALDIGLVALAYYGAFALRFDGSIPPEQMAALRATLFWAVAAQMAAYFGFRLNQAVWRYLGFWDVMHLAAASAAGMAVLAMLVNTFYPVEGFPRSVYPIDSMLQLFLLAGMRALRRVVHDLKGPDCGKRILVVGAGDAGEMIVRDMKHNPYYNYSPIGFVDDDPLKVGRRIHGVRVLGACADLPRIMAAQSPDEVLLAMPRVGPGVLRALLKSLEPYSAPVKTLPNLRDILHGRVTVSDIRNVSLGDLLGRPTVGLGVERVQELIAGRRVMVTGAGGSIGSELCRQIWSFGPAALVMYERYENGLYEIEKEMRDKGADSALAAMVGDVCDESRVKAALNAHRVEVIFHAAAHKHVPLMEFNPCEAIKNNVCGTRTVAEAAARSGVERFILISTDKAVNPSNVMGASKRIAEMLVQDIARKTGLKFAAVRFGNVLGSNGSVVPRFLEQIRAGGPVTVTHPAMTRFFMLIPEAVGLVLHAAAIAEPGAVYVLEMGEQIRILDMARYLVRLAGYVPEKEIKIVYTGLRPGEKLYEELVSESERAEPSAVNNVLVVRDGTGADSNARAEQVRALESSAARGDEAALITGLRALIPAFQQAGVEPRPAETRSFERASEAPETRLPANGSLEEPFAARLAKGPTFESG